MNTHRYTAFIAAFAITAVQVALFAAYGIAQVA